MGAPIDIKGILNAVSDTQEDRKKPVGVHVYFDVAAPADLAQAMEAAFTTEAPHAHVAFSKYGNGEGGMPQVNADVAIIVAGPDSSTGKLYGALHDAGYPTFVVTTCPRLVKKLAVMCGSPFEEGDVLAPFKEEDVVESAEPVALGDSGVAKLHSAMGAWLADVYPEKRLAFAAAFPFLRRALAMDAVNATSMQNGGIGLVALIPGADMPLMTMNQVKMLLQIAAAYGAEVDMSRAKEIAAVVGGGFVCRSAARTLVGLVPALGMFFKAGVGYAGTQAMGHALIEYFEDEGDVKKFANRTVSAAKDIASGKRPVNIPLSVDDLKTSADKAVDIAVKYVVPTAKEMGAVLVKNGLDSDKVAKVAGVAVETVMATALAAFKK